MDYVGEIKLENKANEGSRISIIEKSKVPVSYRNLIHVYFYLWVVWWWQKPVFNILSYKDVYLEWIHSDCNFCVNKNGNLASNPDDGTYVSKRRKFIRNFLL